jgi:archaellum biogenesis protein FlaJ (TadC family)
LKTIFHKNYPYRLWINSILWSAAFLTFAFIIRYALNQKDAEMILAAFFIALIFGAAFSWLIFLLCYFIFHRLPHHHLKQIKRIKPIISVTAILAMLGSCIFFGINLSSPAVEWLIPLCYTTGIIIATFTTKLLEAGHKRE